MRTVRTALVLALLATACAADPGALGVVGQSAAGPVPDTVITEAEQAAGAGDPGIDHVEPTEATDGNVADLAPPIDGAGLTTVSGGTGVSVDAIGSCRPADGYSAGNRVGICVVTVDGKLVEYRTAEAFEAMRADAARSGVHITVVSGFRTMDQQRYLYNLYLAGRGNLAARPGYSNHQSGLALDLNTSGAGVYGWLAANASRYGFRRTVPSEAWHWERPAGSQGSFTAASASDRCWSATLGAEVENHGCVQSRLDQQWYQCNAGAWANGRGSLGACTTTHALAGSSPAPAPSGAQCFSGTLGHDVAAGTCLESRFDRLWYQCSNGTWLHESRIASAHAGPAGACGAYISL